MQPHSQHQRCTGEKLVPLEGLRKKHEAGGKDKKRSGLGSQEQQGPCT